MNDVSKRLFLMQFQGADELYHHGVLGMKWGKRNGPPYPLNPKGQLMKVKSMIEDLNTNWDYGVMINGKRVLDISGVNWKNYRTTPVDTLKREKIGVCWDFVNYQHAVLEKAGYPNKNYMIVSRHSDNPDDIMTHTFTTVSIGGQEYWIESAYWKNRGVHEISSYKDVVNKLKEDLGSKDYDLYEFNPDGMDKGLTDKQYFNQATKNKNLIETSQTRSSYKKII